jgi:hypothetical protein
MASPPFRDKECMFLRGDGFRLPSTTVRLSIQEHLDDSAQHRKELDCIVALVLLELRSSVFQGRDYFLH